MVVQGVGDDFGTCLPGIVDDLGLVAGFGGTCFPGIVDDLGLVAGFGRAGLPGVVDDLELVAGFGGAGFPGMEDDRGLVEGIDEVCLPLDVTLVIDGEERLVEAGTIEELDEGVMIDEPLLATDKVEA